MRVYVLALALVCLSALPAQAQVPIKWTLAIYNSGGTAPIVPLFDIPFPNVTCGQTDPGGVAVNPTKVVFNDVNAVGKVCVWIDPQTPMSPLLNVPMGTAPYEATLTVTTAGGTSPESARASFTRPGVVLGAPTGLKLVR